MPRRNREKIGRDACFFPIGWQNALASDLQGVCGLPGVHSERQDPQRHRVPLPFERRADSSIRRPTEDEANRAQDTRHPAVIGRCSGTDQATSGRRLAPRPGECRR